MNKNVKRKIEDVDAEYESETSENVQEKKQEIKIMKRNIEDVDAEYESEICDKVQKKKDEMKIIPQKTKSSKLQEFFKFSGERKEKVGQCLLCAKHGKDIIIKMTGGNTSGVKRHLENIHKKEFHIIYPQNKHNYTIEECFGSGASKVACKEPFNKENFEEKLIDWLIMKYLPFNFFDDQVTQNFFLYLNKTLTFPKRNTVQKKVLTRFNVMQEGCKKLLQNIGSKISFTIDGWTSVSNKSYYGITAHFIEDWKLYSLTLDFLPSNGRHTGKDIAILLHNVLTSYELKSKVQGITMDNASANTSFIAEFSKLLKNENIDFDSIDQHFRCFGHILNLGVQDTLKLLNIAKDNDESVEMDVLTDSETEYNSDPEQIHSASLASVEKLRMLVHKIKYSEQIKNKFKSCCDTCNLSATFPPTDVKTRWNSTFDMIQKSICMQPAIDLLCINNADLNKFKLSKEEWSLLNSVCLFLRHFKKLTLILGGDKYVTLPLVVIGFNMLLDKIEKIIIHLDNKPDRNNIDETLLLAFQAGRDKMLKHYAKCNWIYCAVLILDPRHKLQSFELTSWGREMLSSAKAKFESIYKLQYYQPMNNSDTSSSDYDDDEDIDVRSLFSSKKIAPGQKTQIEDDSWQTELNNYYSQPKATRDEDILQWWASNENKFPNLARMARDFFSITATSVPAERLFSTASLIIRKHRNRLSPESARAQLCLNSWIKSELKPKIERFISSND